MAAISLKYKSKSGNLTAPAEIDPGAMIPIATTTVGVGGVSTITFSDIPQNYEHLQIRGIGKWTTTANDRSFIQWQFNNDTGANYAHHYLTGSGSGVVSGLVASTNQMASASGVPSSFSGYANMFGAVVFDLLDYKNTSKYKTMRSLTGFDTNTGSLNGVSLSSGLWMSTAAVTSITIKFDAISMAQYTQYALYGIKRAGA